MKPGTKQYLGDGAYAEFNGWHIILTTENGIRVTNTIYLEPLAYTALEAFAKEAFATLQQPEAKEQS